jgi:predicted small lipoprotein YifL
MNRLILMSFIVALLAGPLAACGKKGDPKYPGELPYPRTYPK